MFQSFYGDRFGHDVICMIKDSNTVEVEKLDHEKVNCQENMSMKCIPPDTPVLQSKTG